MSLKYDTIEFSIKNNVAKVKLNRPEVHNAMDEKLMKELTSCFKILSKKEDVKIIILTGNGKSFCAGADLNWMKSMVDYSKEENIRDSNLLLDLYEAIYNCPKPVIGYINGHAFGGGVGLIAVCDLTIGVPDKKYAFSETKLGIIPSVISTYIARRLNISTMRRLFITGERFNSQYANQIGLIDYVVDESEIENKINEYVEILRSSGPKSINEVKKLTDAYEKMKIEEFKKHTVEKISELRVSNEGQEGINAFLQKRKSKWSE